MKCGIGDYTAHLATALAALPDTGVAVLTSRAAAEHPCDVPYGVLPVVTGWRASDLRAILRAARSWHPDVVHMQFPATGYGRRYLPWVVPTVLTAVGLPVVQTWHEYYPAGSGWRNLLNAAIPGGLVVVRPNYLEQMPPWYRRLVARKHFRLIPNAAALPKVSVTPDDRARIRAALGANARRLVVYFGFVYPAKGVETLFDIADPDRDQLAIVADLDPGDGYHAMVLARLHAPPWDGRPRVTGFLPEADAAAILASADAVVLPFAAGGGFWNTSVHAAAKQGAFVVTTSQERRGYDDREHVYYAAPGHLHAMREALRTAPAPRQVDGPDTREDEWRAIAVAHRELYEAVIGGRQ